MMGQFFIVFISLAVLHQVASQGCGIGFGDDVCSPTYSTRYCGKLRPGCVTQQHHSLPIVVRPVELPKPVIQPPTPPAPPVVTPPPPPPAVPVPPLLPIGGPCSCKSTLVKPAIVPRPVCQPTCATTTVNHQVNCQQQQVIVSNGCNTGVVGGCGTVNNVVGVNTVGCVNNGLGYVNGAVTFPGQNLHNPAARAPADAVSLTLAYNSAKKAYTRNEDKLSFGFRQIPKEAVPKCVVNYGVGQYGAQYGAHYGAVGCTTSGAPVGQVVVKRYEKIPENHHLFRINGEIVELKTAKTAECKKSLAEEAAEELLDLAAEEQEENLEVCDTTVPIRKVSLGEIGYAPAKIKSATFVDIPAAVSQAVQDAKETIADAVSSGSGTCKDGFVAGSVSVAEVPKFEPMMSRPKLEPLLEPCDDSIEDRLVPISFGYKQYTTCNTQHQSQQSSSLLQKIVNKLT